MAKEIDIVRWRFNGEDAFPQTHADGVVGLDDYVESFLSGSGAWVTLPYDKKISNGFENAYKRFGSSLSVRINLKNISEKSTIKIPVNLRYPQEFMLNTNKKPIKITIGTDGKITFRIAEYNDDWSPEDYVYQELFFYTD